MFDEGRSLNAPGPREVISTFLAVQMVRGARERHALVEHHKAVARKLGSLATPESIKKYTRRGEDEEQMTDEEAAETAAFARSGEFTIEISRQANLHLGTIFPMIKELLPFFYERSWCVLNFPEPCLVTSDEPVALVGSDPDAPGSAGGFMGAPEIVFPLDPRRALLLVRPDRDVEQGRIPAGPRQAQVINQHVAFAAHRFIVRKPGTDPLAGLTLPERAPAVFEVGDLIGLSPNQSVEARAKVIERAKKWSEKNRR